MSGVKGPTNLTPVINYPISANEPSYDNSFEWKLPLNGVFVRTAFMVRSENYDTLFFSKKKEKKSVNKGNFKVSFY